MQKVLPIKRNYFLINVLTCLSNMVCWSRTKRGPNTCV